jgi:hypothetical protein
MDRVAVLTALNRRLLEAYSRRTTDALRASLPLRVALPHLEPFLALNVEKEVRKDALLIRRAAMALSAGAPAGAEVAAQLLASAREIDREFLARIERMPVRIEIPYAEIEPLRLRRIELALDTAYRVLEGWRRGRRMRQVFAAGDLEHRLRRVLELYAQETRRSAIRCACPGRSAAARADAQRLLDVRSQSLKDFARDSRCHRAPCPGESLIELVG